MLNVSLPILFYDIFLHIINDERALAVAEDIACHKLYDECCGTVSHTYKVKEMLDSGHADGQMTLLDKGHFRHSLPYDSVDCNEVHVARKRGRVRIHECKWFQMHPFVPWW